MTTIKPNPYLLENVDDFVRNNINLVFNICNKYSRARAVHMSLIDYDDLVQVGSMGLLYAYEKYNGQGEFSTYAVPCIKGYILRLLRDTNNGAYYTRTVRDCSVTIIKQKMEEESPESICEKLGQPRWRVNEALDYIKNGQPISIHVRTDDAGNTFETTLHDSTVDIRTWDKNLTIKMFAALLPEKHREVMKGLMAGYTTRQVAAQVGVSQARVGAIWNSILEKAAQYNNGENILQTTRGKAKKVANI